MNLHKTQFSQITLQPDRHLLVFSWLKESETLRADEVKKEISKILEYVDQHSVKNIIVDSTNYQFADNAEIQSWINYKFMAMVMKTPVRKYGFVLRAMSKRYEEHNNEPHHDDELKVAYFPNLNDAHKWIDA